jgi:hypothetical protein
LVHFNVHLVIRWQSEILSPILVYCVKENLATLPPDSFFSAELYQSVFGGMRKAIFFQFHFCSEKAINFEEKDCVCAFILRVLLARQPPLPFLKITSLEQDHFFDPTCHKLLQRRAHFCSKHFVLTTVSTIFSTLAVRTNKRKCFILKKLF